MATKEKGSRKIIFDARELAGLFGVSVWTIRRWVREGYLKPRFWLLGGRCYKLVFLASDIHAFMDDFFPCPGDFDVADPRGRKEKVEMIRRLRNTHLLYAGKARAAALAKGVSREAGIRPEAFEAAEEEAQDEEPVIVDRRPQRGQLQARHEHQGLREVGSCRDGEDDEEEDPR